MKSFAFVLVIIVFYCWSGLVLVSVQSQEVGDQCPAECPAPVGGRQWPPDGFMTDEVSLRCSFRCSARNDTKVRV